MPWTRMAWAWSKHRWFVIQVGLHLGVPRWQLALHDMSKLSPQEFPHYARRFYGGGNNKREFARCWLHHQNHNPHHWQWWVDRSTGKPEPMPWNYVREMVADWMAASRAYEGFWPDPYDWLWYDNHIDKMLLHPLTLARVLVTIDKLKGYYGVA